MTLLTIVQIMVIVGGLTYLATRNLVLALVAVTLSLLVYSALFPLWAKSQCLRYGYPDHSIDINQNVYCLNRMNEDSVIPLSELREEQKKETE